MAKIKPASDLSIGKAVNLYTIIVFLGFGILLFWLATEHYDHHVSTNKNAARNATEISASEVSKIIRNKQRIINIFTDDYKNLIAELSRNPDDEELHEALNSRIKKYFPDFFASNIMTSLGEPAIGDFDGNIGELCLADLRYFVEFNKPVIRVHPNQNVYHYDIVSKFKPGDASQIFFVSFNLSEVGNLLNSVQPTQHKLILVNKDEQSLIEVTNRGSRETLTGRLDFRLNGDEKIRVLSTTKVEGTQWHVIDMYDEDIFSDYYESIIKEYLIVYLIFSIITLYMRSILINQDAKRSIAENSLINSNKNINELNDKLEKLSRTDSLTDLYNRRYFDARLEEEWSRSQRSGNSLSCILFDIDYFKQYNDQYGHQHGDGCLVSVAGLMTDIFRRAGDFVARYGGEEFIVLMTDSTVEDSENAVLQLQKALENLCIVHVGSSVSKYVTISAGLVNLVPSQDNSIDDFIRKADKSLYMAKSAGRNQLKIYEHEAC